ncbi:hypothetical protein B0T25DRAFT_540715 [Lasiosphaeria hispida]|uniref:HNH nuclease domain-containing protein n=1 Tax=Lasiosphaeria hispida TaxID=260671 RepID=A0AAJ0HNT2_9PEZI|nr:hypothetical protein B0T25DRAFT_540715 [Lasiosphaeria hispida]
MTGRSRQDTKAQGMVKTWYGGQCVLSGADKLVQGAHIVDVVACDSMGRDPIQFWNWLKMPWSLDRLKELKIRSRENENILPLRVDAHQFWDSHCFALQPIKHQDSPSSRIYIQMVWLKDLDTEGGLANGNEDMIIRRWSVGFRGGRRAGPTSCLLKFSS